MSEGWVSGKLAKLARVRSGFAFKSSQWTDKGVAVVKISNVKHGRLVMDGCSFVTEQDAVQSGFLLTDGDILIGLTGYVGEVAKVRGLGKLVLNQRVGKFFPTKECDPKFLFFLVSNEDFRQRVETASHGSAQANVSPSAIEAFDVVIPPLPEQRAIAATLGALDDKIELNRKMNATLEAMARALFRDWFVDFGPTRAKMEGRAAYLSPDLWALFPDWLDDEGKPEGWEVRKIEQNCLQVTNGGTPKRDKKEYWTCGHIPWLSSGEVRQKLILGTASHITLRGMQESSAKLVAPGSTAVALYGATAGQVTYLAAEVTTNQAVCSLTPKSGFRAYNFLKLSNETTTLLGMATGSAQQNLSKALVESFPVLVATQPIMNAFEASVAPLFEMMVCNEREARTLAQTRDLLLPRLMSGELRVAEAERIVEEVM